MYHVMDDRLYLLSLISEGEHQQQDFKYKVSDACKLARSVSAFANTDGGRLLIGVRDDGYLSGVKSEEEIFMMHQAAYKYCHPQPSIKFDTYRAIPSPSASSRLRTIVVATVPPSVRKPVYAIDADGRSRAYIRIADENIVASPVHLALWREQQQQWGMMLTYTDTVHQLIAAMNSGRQTLSQIVRRSSVKRKKAITLLARLVRFGVARWDYVGQQFVFSLTG
mgnify:CR=1 FL=1